MQTNRDCGAFRANLDAYLDGELKPSVRQEMDAHLSHCDECRRELNFRTNVRTACAELDEGVEVPPECHAACMRAVRRASTAPRKVRSPALRWASGLAACLAVWLGITAVIRSGGMLEENTSQEAADSDTEYADESLEYDPSPVSGEYDDSSSARGYILSADGSADDTVSSDNTANPTGEQKIVRSAQRSIETSAYDSDSASLNDLVAEYDAYFENRSESGRAISDGGSGRVMDAVIRVPTASLDNFLKSLVALGETVFSADYSTDISDNYYDTETRLATLREQLARLQEMNAIAVTVEDMIAIGDMTQEVQNEIEQMESSLAYLDSQMSYSSVTILITEVAEKDRFITMETTLNERVVQSFKDSLNWLVGFLQDALVVLAMIAPQLVIWIPAALLVFVGWRLVRRALRKHRYV